MVTLMLIVFVLGYIMIAFEHVTHINKATFALLMCGLLWAIYALGVNDPAITHEVISERLITALGDTCEIVIFLIGAMTIVELIDKYGGFGLIINRIHAKNKRGMMWILTFVAFFMSSILDNMTTTIIMVMMLRRMISDVKERWLFACIIVIAANSGGAWSPIGDITTIMLWMKNYVSSVDLVVNLIIPCIVSVVIPTFIGTRMIKPAPMEPICADNERIGYHINEHLPKLSRAILICGVGGLLFVPIFKAATGLPPYMGILISLSILWLITELIVRRYKLDGKMEGRISQALKSIDMPTILFFLGILMAVSALQQANILTHMAQWLDTTIHEPYIISGIIGVLSSIVDNVPLVAACMNMYPVASPNAVGYAAYFVQDGLFWHLLTFCAGVGGSMLIIGSAAGVVAMGIEKISFIWYLKRISWMALAGYIAGIVVIWLETFIISI